MSKMTDKQVNDFITRLMPIDDSGVIDAFIKKYNREPTDFKNDWVLVHKLLKFHDGSDFEHQCHRAKQAIINYWKEKTKAKHDAAVAEIFSKRHVL